MPRTHKGVWSGIEEMIENKQIAAVDEVKVELSRRSDEAFSWSKKRRGLFVPLTPDIQQATREVLARHPRLVYCSLSAFGAGGPLRNKPGYEEVVEAFAGISGPQSAVAVEGGDGRIEPEDTVHEF